jgi:integrase
MANYAISTRTPRTLTEREQRALLKVTSEHRAGFRDHVLYAMALGTGLREHELIALTVGDVFRDGRHRRRLLLSVFKGAAKAGGTQDVLLSESLRGKLRRFHQWKDREREALTDDAPLFVSRWAVGCLSD